MIEMLLIVRLYIDGETEKEWDCIVKNLKVKATKAIIPLYASLLKDKDFISVIFRVSRLDPLVKFLRENLSSCKDVLGTRTLTLIKPVFLPIPKERAKNLCRFTVALKVSIKTLHDVYNSLLNYRYGNDLFPNYISYSLGEWDILISMLAKGREEVKEFVEKNLMSREGVKDFEIRTICKSMHLCGEEEWRALQKSLLHIPTWMGKKEMERNYLYDYDMEFTDYCALTCAMADEL